jgi:hypothetical protein
MRRGHRTVKRNFGTQLPSLVSASAAPCVQNNASDALTERAPLQLLPLPFLRIASCGGWAAEDTRLVSVVA